MKIEQILEMLPTASKQRIAERLLEFLLKNQNVDVLQISEGLSPNKSPSARVADCHGLEYILTDLLALKIVNYVEGCYNPNENSKEALNLLYTLYKPKRKIAPVNNKQPKYLTLFCFYCGEIISTRGPSKSTICPKCGRKNTTGVVLVRTNSTAEFQATVKQEKYKRYSGE